MLKALVTGGIAAASVLTVASPATAATPDARCGALPAAVQGDPHVKAGQPAALYLFHTGAGWNLDVTHTGTSTLLVTGTVVATRAITHLAAKHLERGDSISVSKDGRTLSFRFTNVGHLDGLSFSAECSRALRLNARLDGRGASTTRVHLGARRVHPTSVPFTVERH